MNPQKFNQIGHIATEEELEKIVYLGGAYERRAIKILRGFNTIMADLEISIHLQENKLYTFVKSQRDRLQEVLKRFIQEKLDYINDSKREDVSSVC